MSTRILRVCLGLFVVVLLGINSATAKNLAQIKEKGYLEIAVYEAFPPYSYKSEKGVSVGIDIDLGRAIAKELGVAAGFRLFQADESLEDDLRNVVWKGHYLGGGTSDMMLHVPYDPNFAATIDQVNFIAPYFREEVAFAVNPARIGTAKTLEVFQHEKVGVVIDTLADLYLLAAFGGKIAENVVHYMKLQEATNALLSGELTAVMADRGELEHSLNVQGDRKNIVVTQIPTPGLTVTGWNLGAAVKSSNNDLASEVERIIKKLHEDGTIAQIYADHGVTYSAPELR